MNKPTKQLLQALVKSTCGRFFSVTFRKQDGSTRVMNGKDFYQRLLKGGESTLGDTPHVPVVDRNKNAFRSVNSETLIAFKCGRVSATFNG
jgi:hypothetical protein